MKRPAAVAALLLLSAVACDRLLSPASRADAPLVPVTPANANGNGHGPATKSTTQSAEDRDAPDPNAEPTPEEAAKEEAARAKAKAAATRPSPNTRPASRPGPRPIPAIKRVLVVSIDGLRPDLLLLADTPFAHGLLKRASYSMWAMTTPQSITLPSHVSMMTGVTPNRHGILWNADLPLEYPLYPSTPTLFEEAKRRGYTTAVVAGKDKFDVFDRPGVLDWKWIPRRGTMKTSQVIKGATAMIRDHQPEVMLVHLPSVDVVGHAKGWATPDQMKAIAEADTALSELFAALDAAKLTESTLVIITADHGGQGKGHGTEDSRSRHIPWIAVNPALRQGVDLTTDAKLVIRTEDTFATSCWVLGIVPTNKDLDGNPVKQIQAGGKTGDELLKPAAK
ncbi:MAG TPA: ectonucleotide pyrophosphatase/phosphodiesterase [Humisphaera sp.]